MTDSASHPELVIIVGAGASQSCGIFGSQDLTNSAFSSGTYVESSVRYRSQPVDDPSVWQTTQEVWSLTHILLEALRSIYREPDFELYIHALESLEPLAASRRSPSWAGSLDQVRPVASAFMDVLSRYEPFMRAEILQAERLDVIRRILINLSFSLDYAANRRHPGAAVFTNMLTRIASAFVPSMFTLNYDDLLDSLFPNANDGYNDPGDGVMRFDPASIIGTELGIVAPSLFHLHGNVRFGFGDSVDGTPPPIVKYADKVDALQSFERAVASRDAVRGDWFHAGMIRANMPIISGLQKADKLMLSPNPFGYYYHAAVSALLRCKRVLVLGYGCRDPHINTWIAEASKIHGRDYRLVFVTNIPGNLRGAVSTPETDAIGYFMRSINFQQGSWRGLNDVRYSDDRVMAILSGLPLADERLEELMRFLFS
jgi:hypothetical protein